MSKKYAELGSVCQKKDGGLMLKLQSDITVTNYKNETVTLKKGEYLQVNTPEDEKEQADWLLQNDRINQETYDKMAKRIEEIPDFVMATITAVK